MNTKEGFLVSWSPQRCPEGAAFLGSTPHLQHTPLFLPLIDLCIELGATTLQFLQKGKNETYTSLTTVTEFLECQTDVVENKIQTAVKNSDIYELVADEYIDVSARKHLALMCRYICDGTLKLVFPEDVQLPNAEADTI